MVALLCRMSIDRYQRLRHRYVAAAFLGLVLLLAACGGDGGPETNVVLETAAPSLEPAATETTQATTAPPTLTSVPTTRPTATRTRTPIPLPTLMPSVTPFVAPTSAFALPTTAAMGMIATCNNMVLKQPSALWVLALQPTPALLWDRNPHNFQVTICNTYPLPATRTGQIRAFINFPGTNIGHSESEPVQVQLNGGLNDVTVGPWVPGLENHITACATKPTAAVEIHFEGGTLVWPTGRTAVDFPIGCGGGFS